MLTKVFKQMETASSSIFKMSSALSFKKLQLPQLDFEYGELAPVMSKEQLEVHYAKHHNSYVDNVNQALEKMLNAAPKNDVTTLFNQQKILDFNYGGHINHSFFWKNLIPKRRGGGELPQENSQFSKAIIGKWGSYDAFIKEFSQKALAVQGSGWIWLVLNKQSKALEIMTLANQQLLETLGYAPLMTIDVWEHAYYLDYKNVRPTYLKNIWNVINWKEVEKRYNDSIENKVIEEKPKPKAKGGCPFSAGFQNQADQYIKEQRALNLKGRDTPYKNAPKDFFACSAKDIDGNIVQMSKFKGKFKAMIVTNVATQCGYTFRDYEQFNNMYAKLKDKGLEILAFPCNQFGKQENKPIEETREVLREHLDVKFPLFDRVEVNGTEAAPFFQHLRTAHPEYFKENDKLKYITWNFAKFLINSEGKIVKYYVPEVEPKDMFADVENMLK